MELDESKMIFHDVSLVPRYGQDCKKKINLRKKKEKRESLKIRKAGLWLETWVVQMPRVSVETWKKNS